VFGFGAGLAQQFRPGLFGTLDYRYASSETDLGRIETNTVVVALRQFF
jgi:hypothetical protein